MDKATMVSSTDGQHLAFVVRRIHNQTVWFDGGEGSGYERVDQVLLSPVGGRFAYVASKVGDSKVIVVDGKELGAHSSIDPKHMRFSPDGKHFAYLMWHPTNEFVAVPPFPVHELNGQPALAAGYTPLSIVVDGHAGGRYPSIDPTGLVFSPDSKHWAYMVTTTKRLSQGPALVVLDGMETQLYDAIYPGLAFSPDSRHLAFVVRKKDKSHVVVCNCPLERPEQGQLGNGYDSIADGIAFTPDSKSVVYRAERDGKRVMIVGGEETTPPGFNEFGAPLFSADSQHRAILVSQGNRVLWLVDNEPGVEFDSLGEFLFSPNSHRRAYTGKRGSRWHLVLDEKLSEGFDLIGDSLRFTHEGALLSIAGRDHRYHLVRNLQVQVPEYDWVSHKILLSPDGRHYVFFAIRGNHNTFVVLDGREGPVVSQGPIYEAAFDGNRMIHAIAIDANSVTFEEEFVRLQLQVPERGN